MPVAPGDPYGVGPITVLDRTLVNVAKSEVDAYDIALDYSRTTERAGTFTAFALGTLQTHCKTQVIPTADFLDSVGLTNAYTLKFRDNAGITWKYRDFSFGRTVRYFDSYQVAANRQTSGAVTVLNQGGLRVPSQSYHDLFATWKFAPRLPFVSGIELQAGVKNVFDKRPPLDAGNTQSLSYLYGPFGDPPGAVYYASFKTAF